jgi:hypothetical protein
LLVVSLLVGSPEVVPLWAVPPSMAEVHRVDRKLQELLQLVLRTPAAAAAVGIHWVATTAAQVVLVS